MVRLALLFLLLAAPVGAQDRLFHALVPIYSSAAAWDAKGTIDCVDRGTCYEANPIMRPFVEQHGIRVAMAGKLAVHAGILAGFVLIREKWPEHRIGVNVALAAMTALQVVVDVRNYQTLQKGKQ